MDKSNHLESLTQIREMMEKSSRFVSLSGLSGVFAGLYALAGAAYAYAILGLPVVGEFGFRHVGGRSESMEIRLLLLDAIIVLILSLLTAFFLTIRKARERGQKIWSPVSKRLAFNLMFPLFAGGLFCLALIYNHGLILIPSATLIFYGLALINASKFTLDDIRFLGIAEVFLGLLSAFLTGYGFIFWVIGFGILHIVYGLWMYKKYERGPVTDEV